MKRLLFFLLFTIIGISLKAQCNNYDENNQKQGICSYELNGKLVTCFYKDDYLEGEYIERDVLSGKILLKAVYKNGFLNGLYQEYDNKGRLSFEAEYTNSQKNGYVRYYIKGKLKHEEYYLMNKPHGRWTFYYKNKKIETYFDCINGTCGDIFSYDKRGRLIKKIIRGKDGLREKTIFYNKKRKVIKEIFHNKNEVGVI